MSTTGLRQRKGGITGFVENLDGFTKVTDNVKEEKRATAGFISFVSFGVIAVLVIGELYTHFLGHKQYDYKFSVDTDLYEQPSLKMDFVVATPCNALSVATTNDMSRDQETIVKDPTRFEFTDEEALYWTILRHAHAKMHADGLRGLEDLEYVSDDVEEKLAHLADEKQEAEQIKIESEVAQRKAKGQGGGEIVFMVASGMGMFQMVATSARDEGTACRIHGKLQVKKGKNEKILVALSNAFFHAHGHGQETDTQTRNVSHRIEQFNFGPRIAGLVSPLAGAEQISETGRDVYRYFLKVVPTKIYHGLFDRYTMAYQYSVTFLKKRADSEYTEGGIYFEYEFSATVIEIRERVKTLVQLCVRLCSIVGGVFATSQIVNSLFQSLLCFVGRASSASSSSTLDPSRPRTPHSPSLSLDVEHDRATLLSSDVLVR